MFENILHQDAAAQLARDIQGGRFPQALLFEGPAASGKGTAALELARVLSCENGEKPGAWNCSCPSCARHRPLLSNDLLLLGQKPFYAEISACAAAFRREPSAAVRLLFIRSVRKLLARFSPVLWEDDPKLAKAAGSAAALAEDLEEFETGEFGGGESGEPEKKQDFPKLETSVLKNVRKLESEGPGELIPIAQIRRAAYWSRLAPHGRRKCIIIENADRMQEGARNSLLKILEEPPERLTIILTCPRPKTLLPTMLSRLRRYHFAQRSREEEAAVIRRIFRDAETAVSANADGEQGLVAAYLESFLPVNEKTLRPLAAYWVASVVRLARREIRDESRPFARAPADLERFLASEEGGEEPARDLKTALDRLFKGAESFELSGLFAAFCKNTLVCLSAWLRSSGQSGLPAEEKAKIAGLWKTRLDAAFNSADRYNVQKLLVFERFAFDFSGDLAAL